MRVEVCDQCAGRGGFIIEGDFEYCFACMGDGYLVYEKDPKTIDKSKES
jgi:DnaJ-class molecular chaperone